MAQAWVNSALAGAHHLLGPSGRSWAGARADMAMKLPLQFCIQILSNMSLEGRALAQLKLYLDMSRTGLLSGAFPDHAWHEK